MGNVHLAENLYLCADDMQYIIKEKAIVKDEKTGEERDTYNELYYYRTFPSAIGDAVKILHRRKIARSRTMTLERSIDEYKKITDGFESRLDEIKESLTKNLINDERQEEPIQSVFKVCSDCMEEKKGKKPKK